MAIIRNVLIVGGGTSGWVTATYMAKLLGCGTPGCINITLIESSDIDTIGVGEATILPIRSLISTLGLDEGRFMRDANATFKLAIRFIDWLRAPDAPETDLNRHWFYHAFGRHGSVGVAGVVDTLAPYWILSGAKDRQSFVDYSMMEGRICDAMRGPKRINDPQFQGPVEYAYHFDAGLLAKLLKSLGREHGIKHLIGTVTDVRLDSDGAIASVETNEHGSLVADLYIDCTGFSALLIEKAMHAEFTSFTDTLFCDSAIACQPPYETPNGPILPYTKSTARPHGWIWDIPLGSRRGCGYVYSSKYTDAESAEKHFRDYLGPEGNDVSYGHIKMRIGSRAAQWTKNCVAIGLSAGFIEPLESTGIYLVDLAVRQLVEFLPTVEQMPLAAARFNKGMSETYLDILDFIKLHYAISERSDTDFWIDNRRPETCPQSLLDKLEYWKYRVPAAMEFTSFLPIFGLTSYLQILYGMDRLPDLSGQRERFLYAKDAEAKSQHLAKVAQGGIEFLPDQRSLVNRIYATGFTPPPAGAGGGM